MITVILSIILSPFVFLWSLFSPKKPSRKSSSQSTARAYRSSSTSQARAAQQTSPVTADQGRTLRGFGKDTFLNTIQTLEGWEERLKPQKALKVEIPRGYGKKTCEERWKLIMENEKVKESIAAHKDADIVDDIQYAGDFKKELLDDLTHKRCDLFKDNIENFIGTVKVPLGIAGPIRVNGLHAKGDYVVPLATTEAALVASISRGITVMNQSGGCSVAVIMEGISRDPCLVFKTLVDVGSFLQWASGEFANFKAEAEKSTRFGKLTDVKYNIEGNNVHMKCVYTSGDASGQNIVTIATENICNYIMANAPVKPLRYFLEGGMSGDKKGNASVMTHCRGKKVIAECLIPKHVITTSLHVTPQQMAESAAVGVRGLAMAGTLGQNCHFSNAITAMSIALGQDPACAAEAFVGLARCELTAEGDIYVSVTLPNILVASVGGGTKLPSQRACLEMMGLFGANKANALAEVMAAVVLAGEISLGSAIVSGDFAKAHKLLARDTSEPINLEKDTLEEAFDKAQAQLVKLNNLTATGRDAILTIYGLYKQSTVGDINIDKPALLSTDLKARAKFNAWESQRGKSKEEAMKDYIDVVLDLVEKDKNFKSK